MSSNDSSNFSAFQLLIDEPEISFLMFFGLMFNFAAILLNLSVILAILSLKYCRRRQFYVLVVCLCSADFAGRLSYAVFLIQAAICLSRGLDSCRMATWRCFSMLSFSYVHDATYGWILTLLALDRFWALYSPAWYKNFKSKRTAVVALAILGLFTLFVWILPTLYREAMQPQYLPCVAYFTGFTKWQAKAMLFNRLIGRFSAILINLLTIVYIRFVVRYVRIAPHDATVIEMQRIGQNRRGDCEETMVNSDGDGAARYFFETQMQLRDYVKILILIDTFFGLPYSIVAEISSFFAEDTYSTMLLMAVTVFCTTLSGVIDPALFIRKNKYVRKRISSIFVRNAPNTG